MGKCVNCGKQIGRREKLRVRMMINSLSSLEKIKNLSSQPSAFSNLIEKIDYTAGADLATFKKLNDKGWCIDCIVASKSYDEQAEMKLCPNCNSEISLEQEKHLKKIQKTLELVNVLPETSTNRTISKRIEKLNNYLGGNKELVLELLEKGLCPKCITEKCGKDF